MDEMEPDNVPDQLFPNELLFKILEKVESKKDLLNCRLVSKAVNGEVTKLFSKHIHSEFVQWSLYHYPEQRDPSANPPKMRMHSTSHGSFVQIGKMSPNVNPLISSTLSLVDRGASKTITYSINTLLHSYGSYLRSISIFKSFQNSTFMSMEEVSKLLAHCPNLEAIRIRGGVRVGRGHPEKPDIHQVTFPNLPKLHHIEIDDAFALFRWLLPNLSHQLTHLQSCNQFILPFTTENFPQREGVEGAPFQKLKTLKLDDVPNKFLWNTGISIPIQLEKLSIIYTSEVVTCPEDLCEFVVRFRDSLKELHFESMGSRVTYPNGEPIHGHCYFPKLRKFSYVEYNSSTHECVETAKKHFLPYFPNLVELNLRWTSCDNGPLFTLDDAKAYVERNQLWNYTPTLKNIRFLKYSDSQPNERPLTVVVHNLTRQN